MTGSTLDMILISLVVVIVLAAWIPLVFYGDALRREAPAGHGRNTARTPRPGRRRRHHRRDGTGECPPSGEPGPQRARHAPRDPAGRHG